MRTGIEKENVATNMTKTMVTIGYGQSIEEAYAMMQQWGVRHLPVRDGEGRVVGLLADCDIFRAMDPVRPGFPEGRTVSDYMSWPALTIDEATPVAAVADTMLTERVSALLVTGKDGEPTGIVTNEDLLKVLRRALGAENSFGISNDEPAAVEELREGEAARAISILPYSPVVREAMRELQSVGI